MAPRAFWKGYLKFSLVSCRVAMSPATSDREKLRFHTLNRQTGNRVQSRYIDAVTGQSVEDDDQVKGYPLGDDEHVIVEDEELEAVALESTRTIDIETFTPRDSIGWIWLDKPHHLVPDDKAGEEAFTVIRDAMRTTETVGISRVVLYRRERAVMIEPCGKGLIAWTLRYGDEVRDADPYYSADDTSGPDSKLLKMVKALIDARTKPWSPDMVRDPVQENLLEIIEKKKKKGKGPKRKPAVTRDDAEASDNVVSITEALRRSIAAEKGKGKKKGQ